jgi:hypothetical protein
MLRRQRVHDLATPYYLTFSAQPAGVRLSYHRATAT